MNKKQIAVVSTNATLTRFFELECRMLGCAVQTYSKMPVHTEEYDCVFVDVDTVRHYVSHHTRTVTVSQKNVVDSQNGYLPWPTPVEQIRMALDGGQEKTVEERADKTQGTTLWIQSRERREIRYGNQIVSLSASEFSLLESLSNEEKKPVDRETLLRLFGTGEGNIVDVYVCLLRKKLEQMCERRVIDTVRGVGYRLNLSLRDVEAE